MLVKEYLEQFKSNERVTFVIAKAVKDGHSPIYHYEFYQTPIRYINEWLESENTCNNYIVIKKDTMPIDITGAWDKWYKSGDLKCCMVTTETDIRTMYKEEQANRMIEFYDKEVRK